MFIECRHIMPRGVKCKAAALRDRPYCYFHEKLHDYTLDGLRDGKGAFCLPSLEDACGIQMALMQIMGSMACRWRFRPSTGSPQLRRKRSCRLPSATASASTSPTRKRACVSPTTNAAPASTGSAARTSRGKTKRASAIASTRGATAANAPSVSHWRCPQPQRIWPGITTNGP